MSEKKEQKEPARKLYAPIVLTGDSLDHLDELTAWVRERHKGANRSDVMRTALCLAVERVRKMSKKP